MLRLGTFSAIITSILYCIIWYDIILCSDAVVLVTCSGHRHGAVSMLFLFCWICWGSAFPAVAFCKRRKVGQKQTFRCTEATHRMSDWLWWIEGFQIYLKGNHTDVYFWHSVFTPINEFSWEWKWFISSANVCTQTHSQLITFAFFNALHWDVWVCVLVL